MKKTIEQQLNDIYDEYKLVSSVTGTTTIEGFKKAIEEGKSGLLIGISEELMEKKIVHLVDRIRKRDAKIVLIAGPSSSGKTTFSKRLSMQLLACGRIPHPISLDNYYVDRTRTPKDENGEYDYETIYALDIDYLKQQMQQLINGERVELPRYDFQDGKSIRNTGKFLQLGEDDILIVEGIHGLNPLIAPESDAIYKVFVAPMTGLQTGEKDGRHTYTPPVDNRLLRRIIRDIKHRNASAQDTIHRWTSVRKGEDKWIFPFVEQADRIFNTALYYELAVIKPQAESALRQVPEDCPEYATAQRLLAFLADIPVIPEEHIPHFSLLCEFIGNSVFEN